MANGGEPDDKLRALYDGLVLKYDNLGSYDDFIKRLNDPTARKSLYDFASKDFSLGSFEDYEQKINDGLQFSKKKETFEKERQNAEQALQASGLQVNQQGLVTTSLPELSSQSGLPSAGSTSDLAPSTLGPGEAQDQKDLVNVNIQGVVSAMPRTQADLLQSQGKLSADQISEVTIPKSDMMITFNQNKVSNVPINATFLTDQQIDPGTVELDENQRRLLNILDDQIGEFAEGTQEIREELIPGQPGYDKQVRDYYNKLLSNKKIAKLQSSDLLDMTKDLPDVSFVGVDETGGLGFSAIEIDNDKFAFVSSLESGVVEAVDRRKDMELMARQSNAIELEAINSNMTTSQYVENRKDDIVDELTTTVGLESGGETGDDPLRLVGDEYRILRKMQALNEGNISSLTGEEMFDFHSAKTEEERRLVITNQLSSLNKELRSIRAERFDSINTSISEAQRELTEAETDAERRSAQNRIDYLNSLKSNVFETDPIKLAQRVAANTGSNSDAVTIMQLLPQDLSAKEKFDQWYYTLYRTNRRLGAKLGLLEGGKFTEVPFGMQTRDMLDISIPGISDGDFNLTKDEIKFIENERVLREMASVFFTNSLAINSDEEGFLESTWDSYSQWVTPRSAELSNPMDIQTANNVLETISTLGFEQGAINKDAVDALSRRATPQALLGEGFSLIDPSSWDNFNFSNEKAGQITGTILGAGVFYSVGGGVTKALGAPLGYNRLVKAIDQVNKTGKMPSLTNTYRNSLAANPGLVKYFGKPFTEGVKFEITGRLFPNHDDEFNFMSGFAGTFFGDRVKPIMNAGLDNRLTSNAITYLTNVFGDKAPKVIDMMTNLGARGAGEVTEEFAQEMVNIWQTTSNGQQFLEELRDRFPDVASVEEFVITSFGMGLVMGDASSSNYFQQKYGQLTTEQKERVAPYLDEMTQGYTAAMNDIQKKAVNLSSEAAEDLGIVTEKQDEATPPGVSLTNEGNVSSINNIATSDQTQEGASAYKINDSYYSEQEFVEILSDPATKDKIQSGEMKVSTFAAADPVVDKMVETGVIRQEQGDFFKAKRDGTSTNEAVGELDVEADSDIIVPEVVRVKNSTPDADYEVAAADYDNKLTQLKDKGALLDQNVDQNVSGLEVISTGEREGRLITEVKYPDGQTQLFYKSSEGTTGKVQGEWYPIAGFINERAGRFPKGWFIKDFGVNNRYDSQVFQGTADYLLTNEGVLFGVETEQEIEQETVLQDVVETTKEPPAIVEQEAVQEVTQEPEPVQEPEPTREPEKRTVNQIVLESLEADLAVEEGEFGTSDRAAEIRQQIDDLKASDPTLVEQPDPVTGTEAERPRTAPDVTTTPPASEKKTFIGRNAKTAADFLRSKKFNQSLSDLQNLKSDPTGLFQVAVDGALEAAATALEASGVVADAISSGLDSLRNSDWYKNLSENGQQAAEQIFEQNIIDQIDQNDDLKTGEDVEVESAIEQETPSEELVEDSQGDIKKRRLKERVMKDPTISDVVKETFANEPDFYESESNGWQNDRAEEYINAYEKHATLEDLEAEVRDLNNGMSGGVRSFLAQKLARRYELMDMPQKAASLWDFSDSVARDFGRFIQALDDRHPDAVSRNKKQEFEEKKKNVLSKKGADGVSRKEKIDGSKRNIDDPAQQAGENIAEGETIRKAIDKAKKNKSFKKPKKKTVAQTKIKEARNERRRLKEEAKKNRGQFFHSTIPGLTSEGIEFAGRVAATYIKEGFFTAVEIKNKLKAFFKEEFNHDLSDSDFEKIMDQNVDGQNLNKLAEAQIEEKAVESLSDRVANLASRLAKGPSQNLGVDSVKLMVDTLFKKATDNITDVPKPTGKKALEEMVTAVENIEESRRVWDRAQIEVEMKLQEMVDNGELTQEEQTAALVELDDFFEDFVGKPFSKKTQRKAVQQGLKDLEITIKDLARKHWTKKQRVRKNLSSKIIEETGLDIESARIIQDAILEEFDSQMRSTMERELAKAIGTTRIPLSLESKRRKRTIDRVIEAYNLGAMNSEFYRDLFSEKFGFVALSDVDNRKIDRFITAIATYPENSELRERALTEMEEYFDSFRRDPFKIRYFSELMSELFYTNILSGLSTLERGSKGVLMTSIGELMVEMAKNPSLTITTMHGANALWRGFKEGRVRAAQMIRDGYSPLNGRENVQTRGELEKLVNKPFKEIFSEKGIIKGTPTAAAKAYMYLPVKMVRMLAAADALAHYTVQEYFATVKAYNQVLTEGMSRKEEGFWNEVYNKLQPVKEEEARLQAEEEVADLIEAGVKVPKNAVETRTKEIMDENRNQELTDWARDKADRSRLGNDPFGTLGMIYQIATNVTNKFILTERLIPFLRIPTNAMDMWLDWSPYGFKRIAVGRGIGLRIGRLREDEIKRLKIGRQNMTPDERVDHLIKASVGTAVYAALMTAIIASLEDDDPENDIIQISYKGHGDFKSNEGLRKIGWKETSIKFNIPGIGSTGWVDYKDSPLAMILASVGSYHDQIKYQGALEEEDQAHVIQTAVTSSLLFVSEQNYMQSVANFTSLFESAPGKEEAAGGKFRNFALREIAKNIQATFFPNIYKQAYQTYKAVNGVPQRYPARYSDSWQQAVWEGVIKDIPYLEDYIKEEAFDQLGYPVVKRVDDIPLVPEFVFNQIAGIQDDKSQFPLWELAESKGMIIPYDNSRTYKGVDLDPDQQMMMRRYVAESLQQYMSDNFDMLEQMEPERFEEKIKDMMSRFRRKGKKRLFRLDRENKVLLNR